MRKLIFLLVCTFLCLDFSYSQQWSPIINNNIWNLNSGNVGIGTNGIPQSKLDVNGEITLNGRIGKFLNDKFTYNSSYLGHYSIGWFEDNWTTAGQTLWMSGYGGIKFFTAGTAKLSININGKVGVGTSYPKAGIEIYKENTNDYALMLNSSGLGWGSGMVFRNSYNNNIIDYGIYNGCDKKLHFSHPFNGDAIIIDGDKVGIGESSPKYKLDVRGTIHAQEVRVDMNEWSDFVFNKGYKLAPLKEVYNYIKENGHLPNIPSEKELKENGINITKIQSKLLQKIEELTLYIIEQEKRIKELENIINIKVNEQ